jgi:PAS domain S-box-containing protein
MQSRFESLRRHARKIRSRFAIPGNFASSNLIAAAALVFPVGSCLGLLLVLRPQVEDSQRMVEQNAATLGTIYRISSLLTEAESAQRGFLLTGGRAYREPFARVEETALENVGRLVEMNESSPDRMVSLPLLSEIVKAKFRELHETFDLADQGRMDEAIKVVRSDRGLTLMRAASAILSETRDRQSSLLETRRAAANTALHHALVLTSFSALFAVLASAGSLWLAARESRRRLASESAMRASEARYRTLADNATDMIILKDARGPGLYISPACRRMLGYDPDEMAAMTTRELAYPDDAEAVLRAYNDLSGEHPQSCNVYRLRTKGGGFVWVETVLRWVEATDEEPARILGVVRDITGRKQAEEETSRAKSLLGDAIDAMQDLVALYDQEDRLVLTNDALRCHAAAAAVADVFAPGCTYERIVRGYLRAAGAMRDEALFDAYLVDQLERHRRADGAPGESRGSGGSWFITRHFRAGDGILTVSTDITAAKRAAEEIDAARLAAEAANRAKSDFLASMSHEIRTPMNGVIGFADILLDSNLSHGQREDVERIRDAGKSLLAIINDILDISKIEAGKLELETTAISPLSIIDAATSILKTQIMAKGLALRIHQDADVPAWILGDPTRVRQILLNLLSNALKFTASGFIELECRRDGGPERPVLRFQVKDTGIGIPADRQHLLFKDFSQVDRSTTRRYGGTGLGLSICKRLAEAMGGEIGVVSEVGRGTAIWFTMLLVETDAPVHQPADTDMPTGAAPARILVAEDLPMNQLIVKAMLRAAGHEVTVVDNGAEALAAIQSADFDLVLMDMEMPEMDGPAATRAIRDLDGPARNVPIIALTANAMLEDAATCKAAGMNDFLSKPIDRSDLAAIIAKWLLAKVPDGGRSDAPPRGASVLDDTVLQQLERIVGKDVAEELQQMFRLRIAQMIPVFTDCTDPVALAGEAHQLISLAGNIGCTELMDVARALSDALKEDAPSVPALTATIVDAVDRALSALDQRLAA